MTTSLPEVAGQLIRPGDADYDDARKVWNGAIDRRPALIARCAGAADAAAALRHALDHNLPVAIRGGGHNVAGSALVDGGVVIDFSRLRGLQVDPHRRVAAVEPGALWGDCDRATQPFGLAIPGGIVTHTGVAGLTLGGGLGWAMRRFGYTSDNLLSAALILADGTRVSVDAASGGDLFWALQGGGGNFGIVTRFTFRLQPIGPQVLAGPILYPAERAAEVLRGYRDVIADAPDELAVFVNLRRAPALDWVPEAIRGRQVVMVIPCYLGDPEVGERIVRRLRELGEPLADLVRRTTWISHQGMFDASVPHGRSYYWKSHYLPPLTDPCIEALAAGAYASGSAFSYTLMFHLGGQVSRHPDGASAASGRDCAHVLNINAAWDGGGSQHPDVEWVRGLWRDLTPHASGGTYVNFLGNESSDVVRAAYGDTYDRLARIKARYDPANVFRVNQNIIPAGGA